MAAKLLVLVASVLRLSALSSNEVGNPLSFLQDSKVPDVINMDAATAKEAKVFFQQALDDEKPGLEATKQAAVQPHSQTSNQTSDMKVSPYAADVAAALPTWDHVTEFEKDMTELIIGFSKTGLAATPMGGSVQKIKDLITKDMMPKVIGGHNSDQKKLNALAAAVVACTKAKEAAWNAAYPSFQKYQMTSPTHKTCRVTEAGLYKETHEAWKDLKTKTQIKIDKCKAYSAVSKKVGEQNTNKQIVTKSGSESVEAYVKRISSTICGKKGGKGTGGYGDGGFVDELLDAKHACQKATKDYNEAKKKFEGLDKKWHETRKKCDNLQDEMDAASCKYATAIKDACETYAECHKDKKAMYLDFEKQVRKNETDRKAEWRGLKRMNCLIDAFGDSKVQQAEIDKCKNTVHKTDHLNITYPKINVAAACAVPDAYPYTVAYKKIEFAPLPNNAKGKMDANECSGIKKIDTTPAPGSPSSCKCTRVTLNGPYSAGAMVKCESCLTIRKSTHQTSCPLGTKLFAPQSRQDWDTFIKSASPLRAPNWIIDVTRPQNGCGGCTGHPMNSGNAQQKTWRTQDGTPWWLRSTRYNEPNGDYHANCYLDLWRNPSNSDSVTWNDGSCSYRSKSYYCQLKKLSLTPKPGSPSGCKCTKVQLVGSYSPGILMKCTNCLTVYKSLDKNSCPSGTKLFAPATREDWKTFLASATSLRAPHWIIDVTRPQNSCGGCTRHPMNKGVAAQATWKTKDGAPWWLRSSRYNEPNGDYNANCYLDLWRTPSNENSVTFNDWRCNYRSKSYYCQAMKGSSLNGPKYTSTAPPWKASCSTVPSNPATTPSSCRCTKLELKGQYSTGCLVKCENCLNVKMKGQKNSCPVGTKLFSPQTREDWKTFLNSGGKRLAAPRWIIDVTRPQNGCGGCTRHDMNSGSNAQSTWRTEDGSPWWLRSSRYNEPNGDYTANCYLDLWHNPSNENTVTFNDWRCNYNSKSYYCQ